MRRTVGAALRRLGRVTAPKVTVVVLDHAGPPDPSACVASVRASVGVRAAALVADEHEPLDVVVSRVRDPFVAFVGVEDTLEPDGLAALVDALRHGGVLAAGRRVVRRGSRRPPVPPPGSPVDLALAGKAMRTPLWERVRPPGGADREEAVTAALLAAAGGAIMVDRVVVRRDEADVSLPVREQRRFRPRLAAHRFAVLGEVLDSLPPPERTAWCTAAVADLLPGLAQDAVGGGPAYADALRPFAQRVVEELPNGADAPVEARLAVWVAAYAGFDGLARAITHLLDHPHGLPVAHGRAVLPEGLEVPDAWRALGEADRRPRVRVLPRVADAAVRGDAFVTATRPVTPEVLVDGDPVATRPWRDPGADAWAARAFEDHADSGFELTAPPGARRVAVTVGDHRVEVPVTSAPAVATEAVVERATLEAPGLRLRGTGPVVRARLSGAPGTTPWADAVLDGDDFEVLLPLVSQGFGEQTAARGGRYRLEAQGDRGRTLALAWSSSLLVAPPDLVDDRLGLAPVAPDGVDVGGPLTRADASAVEQQRRVTAYAGARTPAGSGTVVLESFHGRAVSDNPAAIGRELLRRDLGLDLVWVVDDPGVTVPDGTRAAPRRTRAWYDVLAHAHAIVQNAAAPPWFEKKPGQVHLQTWHGTPLKRIGEDRGPGDVHTWRHRHHLAQQAARWDAMVSPSPFCSEVFASAFRYAGPFLEVGYPRNDVLLSDHAPDVRRDTRARLGLEDPDRVLLYAPTWREYVGVRDSKPLFLDAEALVASRPDTVVLVRGHYNATRQPDAYTGRSRILDVTRYPDIADLYLAADVLVTDYSSVMFDFALTDKPMLLLVPDLAQYRDVERGFYLDLESDAPGPLLTDTHEVLEHLAEPDGYADARAAFRDRFTPYDDGAAASRVCDWLLTAIGLRA